MLLKVGLLFITAAFVLGQETITDEDVDAAFRELEQTLNDKQEIKDLLQEVKTAVTAKPDYAKNAYGMAKALNAAVPKLKSNDGLVVAEGVLAIIAGIAENVPGGFILATFASVISSIFGLVSSKKADDAIKNAVREVIREESDQELEDKADASRAELTAAWNYLQSKHSQELDEQDVTRMVIQVKVTTGVGILELLAKRIRQRSKSANAQEARRSYLFCLLYAEIATFRDMVVNDLIILIRRAGDADEANSYENAKNDFVNSYRNTLEFLHQPTPEQAGAVSYYYPLRHSKQSAYIYTFMKMAGIADPTPWLPSKYLIISVKWPSYHLDLPEKRRRFPGPNKFYEKTLTFMSTQAKSSAKIEFIKRADGFWQIKTRNAYIIADSADSPNKPSAQRDPPGEIGHFIIVKYPNTDIITIAFKKWPHKFFKGESGTNSVVIRDGNTGKDTQFYATECRKSSSETESDYQCPEYTPKKKRA